MCATKQFLTISFQHRDTADNNSDTPFEFTAENLKVYKIDKDIKRAL